MPTCIVIGGAGFIGSHLVDRLIKEGWSVIVVDNLSTGSWSNLRSWKTEQLQMVEHDITESLLLSLREIDHVDVIVYMASPASPVHYRRLALETLRANSLGVENAIQWSMELGARFLFASTSEIYGEPEISPQPETYWGRVNPVGVRACYDEGKRFGEALTMEYHRKYNFNISIVRIFNCYGPRMQIDDGRVVPNFIKQVLKNEPLTIYGDGKQTRSFCYVSDTVDSIFRIITNEGLSGEIINIGNPHELTILDLAKTVAKIANVQFIASFRELPSDDPTNRCPDISKARKLLGWTPSTDLIKGLSNTYDYFRLLLMSE